MIASVFHFNHTILITTYYNNTMALSPEPYTLYFFLLFMMLLFSSMAQTQKNISLGSSLTAANKKSLFWESPSGDFAFGFQNIEKAGFLLAIWFNKIPARTIVWSANRDSPVQEGSKVELTKLGLVLKDPKGNQIWTSSLSGTDVAHGAMLDTGNLVLANQNSASLWESFKEPTDTLLVGQTLAQEMKLVARYSETNYSSGRFQMILRSDGNLLLYKRRFPLEVIADDPYWSTNTVSGFQLMFNQSGLIYLEAKNGTVVSMLTSVPTTPVFYQRAILEYDGVFRQYVYPKRNDQSSDGVNMAWTRLSDSIPINICVKILERFGGGACGFNSYCKISNDQRRSCLCPPGYTWIDPDDEIKGCRQNFEAQSCDKHSGDVDNFSFISINQLDMPWSDYEMFTNVNEDFCRKACLGDCLCGSIYIENDRCWKRTNPFSNARLDDTIIGKALIKVRSNNSTSKIEGTCSKKKDQSTLVLIGSILLSSSVFVNVLLVVACLLVLFHFRQKVKAINKPNQFSQELSLQNFTYAKLEQATNGFEELLGRGAFASVFKGVLLLFDSNECLVAVKKLEHMVTENEREFTAEVTAIGRTNHKNLVRLIGFCNEGLHRLLIYEYMSNGTLANFLFGPSKPNWFLREKIAMGIARGLLYLHEECSTQILHCDIKPQNILLDDSYTARISDFGLAKILKKDQTRTTTGIRGTKGYVAPEWFRNMPVTVKVDVYSYGVLLLEIICCRRNVEEDVDEAHMILADWAYDCYASRRLDFLVENDDEAFQDMKRVEKYVMVALWCIQEDPSLRPTMKKVMLMLEGTVEVSAPPDPASFISSI